MRGEGSRKRIRKRSRRGRRRSKGRSVEGKRKVGGERVGFGGREIEERD